MSTLKKTALLECSCQQWNNQQACTKENYKMKASCTGWKLNSNRIFLIEDRCILWKRETAEKEIVDCKVYESGEL